MIVNNNAHPHLNPCIAACLLSVLLSSHMFRGPSTLIASENLFREFLNNYLYLVSCKNLDSSIKELAKDLRCKFHFSYEILSGRGPKLATFLDLGIPLGRETWET